MGSADDLKAARWIYDRLLTVNASLSEPNWAEWANTIRLMRVETQAYSLRNLRPVPVGQPTSSGKTNILSPSSLRKQWINSPQSGCARNRNGKAIPGRH